MAKKHNDPMAEWLASRPTQVRRLAAEFPLGSEVKVNGKTLFVIGYTEDDVLIFSTVDPYEDAAEALDEANRKYIHAHHLRPH